MLRVRLRSCWRLLPRTSYDQDLDFMSSKRNRHRLSLAKPGLRRTMLISRMTNLPGNDNKVGWFDSTV